MTSCSLGRRLLAVAIVLFAAAAWAGEHPVPLEKDADCNQCHEAKSQGKAVHSAIKMGCTSCHEVKTEGETTTINFVQPESELCFSCHEKSEDRSQHGPYESGRCVLCHDPHASDFPKQLRASANDLCVGCHVPSTSRKGDVREVITKKMGPEELAKVPQIRLNRSGKGHPFDGHPVFARPSQKKHKAEAELSCFSCHLPHTSKVPHLGYAGTVQKADVLNWESEPLSPCIACHVRFDWRSRNPQQTVIFWEQ